MDSVPVPRDADFGEKLSLFEYFIKVVMNSTDKCVSVCVCYIFIYVCKCIFIY